MNTGSEDKKEVLKEGVTSLDERHFVPSPNSPDFPTSAQVPTLEIDIIVEYFKDKEGLELLCGIDLTSVSCTEETLKMCNIEEVRTGVVNDARAISNKHVETGLHPGYLERVTNVKEGTHKDHILTQEDIAAIPVTED